MEKTSLLKERIRELIEEDIEGEEAIIILKSEFKNKKKSAIKYQYRKQRELYIKFNCKFPKNRLDFEKNKIKGAHGTYSIENGVATAYIDNEKDFEYKSKEEVEEILKLREKQINGYITELKKCLYLARLQANEYIQVLEEAKVCEKEEERPRTQGNRKKVS